MKEIFVILSVSIVSLLIKTLILMGVLFLG